jgi:Tfp pilus assembly ATPase PilU
MDAVFTDEDHTYIMREARRIDASGEEARRRAQIVDFRVQTAEMHRIKALAKMQKEARSLQDNLSRVLVPLSEMDALKIPEIHEQLNAYRARGVPNILVNSKYPRKAEKLAALKDVFRWFEANGTLPVFPSIPQNLSDVVPAVAEERCDEEEREMEE